MVLRGGEVSGFMVQGQVRWFMVWELVQVAFRPWGQF